MSNCPLSRKAREKLARQQEIVAAARELFLRQGYHETTLEEIAHHAEFGKGTIYNYFASKEDLFLAICEQLILEMEDITRRTLIESEGESRQRLTAYADSMIRYSRDNVKLITLVMHRIHQIDREKIKPYLTRFSSVMRSIWHTISIPVRLEQEQQGGCAYDPLKLAILFDGLVRTYNMSRFGPLQSMPEEEID